MIYIDILTYEFADISENTANLPLDWPYQSKHVYDSTQLIEDNWVRLTEQGYEDYITDVDRVARYNTALAYSTNSRTLRISSIIDDSFSTLPIDKIDFNYIVDKIVSMSGGSGGGTASYPSFTGNAGKVLTVNATEDGVEWTTVSAQAGEIVPTP